MLDDLAGAVARHGAAPWADTAVPHLALVRLDEPVEATDMLLEPAVCFPAAGAVQVRAGHVPWHADAGTMLLSPIEMPVTVTVPRVPFRAAVLRLDERVVADRLDRLGRPPRDVPAACGTATAAMPPALADAVLRWVRLLGTPGDIPARAGRIESEIVHHLLAGPLGPVLRQFARADSRLAQVRVAAHWIRQHFTQPLTVDAVAAAAHLSVPSLHRHFKAATGMSPVQFQKRLRLLQARRLLSNGGLTAAAAASAVGYASPTQFSREYRREYGMPPGRDAAALRTRSAG